MASAQLKLALSHSVRVALLQIVSLLPVGLMTILTMGFLSFAALAGGTFVIPIGLGLLLICAVVFLVFALRFHVRRSAKAHAGRYAISNYRRTAIQATLSFGTTLVVLLFVVMPFAGIVASFGFGAGVFSGVFWLMPLALFLLIHIISFYLFTQLAFKQYLPLSPSTAGSELPVWQQQQKSRSQRLVGFLLSILMLVVSGLVINVFSDKGKVYSIVSVIIGMGMILVMPVIVWWFAPKRFLTLSRWYAGSTYILIGLFTAWMLFGGGEYSSDGRKLRRELQQPEKVTELNLETGYASIPTEIGQFTNLRKLVVNSPEIDRLPPEIGKLTNLQELYIHNSKITSLPTEVGHLQRLQKLTISGRNGVGINELPASFAQLQQLRELTISDSQLAEFPLVLVSLRQLQILDLSGNHIQFLPPPMGQLINLRRLDMQGNRIQGVAPELANLKSLEVAYFSTPKSLETENAISRVLSHVDKLYFY